MKDVFLKCLFSGGKKKTKNGPSMNNGTIKASKHEILRKIVV